MDEQGKSLIESTPFFGKPREIAGRKAMGSKPRAQARRHGSPAANFGQTAENGGTQNYGV